jgi:hypothetical protein
VVEAVEAMAEDVETLRGIDTAFAVAGWGCCVAVPLLWLGGAL